MQTRLVKKSMSVMMIVLTILILGSVLFESQAAVVDEPYVNDSFDSGLNDELWQVVNDPEETIGFAGQSGQLRYVDAAGAEEAMVTTDPLTSGEGVTGYSVEFDFEYLSADWGDWFAFAFNKTSVVKGLDWGKGGYLMARITSLQVNNAADSVDGPSAPNPGVITSFEEMTPTIPSIANQNIRFKFVYTSATQELELYYDLVSEEMDLDTLRNSFTLGSLTDEEDYHFSIVSSGKGLYNLDNFVIHQLTDSDPIEYLNTDFESDQLPAQISLAEASKFSYGPARQLEFDDVDPAARFLTASPFIRDPEVADALKLSYEQDLAVMPVDLKFGFLFGLETGNEDHTEVGVTELYFVNRDVEGVVTTFVGATSGDGESAVQVLPESSVGADLTGYGPALVSITFKAFGNVHVDLDGLLQYSFKATDTIAHFGFTSDSQTHVLIDNFKSTAAVYYDQSESPDLHENFNTGYMDDSLWEIYNYPDLRPGTELPLFPSAQGIHVADGKLVFDVAGESSRLISMNDYANVEVRFTLEDFGKPTTPMNEDGEIDGVEVPPTFYVALSFGYESTTENFWNVPTIIFQARDGGAVIYTLNMNDAEIYPIDPSLLLSALENEGETFEFKVTAINGNVDIWMKRASDPIALFDGEPTVSYTGVNTVGRVAVASSAAGSFKIDDMSIEKVGGIFDQPIIEDSIDPSTLIAPVIEVSDEADQIIFEQNADVTVDFKDYFSVTDQGQTITVTDGMLDLGGFSLTRVGQYEITLTVTDEDGNTSVETITATVYPETVEPIEDTGCTGNHVTAARYSTIILPLLGIFTAIGIVVLKKR
jgi:hypothetical protein